MMEEGTMDLSQPADRGKYQPYSFDDAVKQTKQGKFHTLLIMASGFSILGLGVENLNISLALPFVKCELKLTTAEQVLLSSAVFIGVALGSEMWAFLADKMGRRKVIQMCLLGSFTYAITSAFITSVSTLIMLRLTVGIMIAGVQSVTFAYVTEFHCSETSKKAASSLSAFFPAVFIYLPSIAYLVIPLEFDYTIFGLKLDSWRLYMMCTSSINLINFIAMTMLPESPRFLYSTGKKEETMAVLRYMYAKNTGNPEEQYPVKSIVAEPAGHHISHVSGVSGVMHLMYNQSWPLLVKPHLVTMIQLCCMMFYLFAIGYGNYMWFPDFLSQIEEVVGSEKPLCEIVGTPLLHNTTTVDYSYMNSIRISRCNVDKLDDTAFLILYGAGLFVSILSAVINFVIDRIGLKLVINLWLAIVSIACLSMTWLDEFYTIIIMYYIFFSCIVSAAIIITVSVHVFPSNYRAMATCQILMFGILGAVCGSHIIGQLLHSHCDTIFYSFYGMVLGCLIIFHFLVKKL